MKYFILRILQFSLIALLIFLLLELVLLKVPNDYSYKRDKLELDGNSINTLILGASHGENCIDPSEFGDSCFNAAISARLYCYDAEIVKKYVPNLPNLKCIILPVVPFLQYMSLKDYGVVDNPPFEEVKGTRRCEHFKYMKLRYDIYDWFYWSEIVNSKHNLINRLLAGGSINCNDKGYTPLSLEKIDDWQNKQLSYPVNFNNPNYKIVYEENLRYLIEMVLTCKDNDVVPVFVTVPHYITARNNIPPKDLECMYNMIHILKDYNPRLEYLNFIEDSNFTDADYYNASHVNESGARKLSKMIYNILKSRSVL